MTINYTFLQNKPTAKRGARMISFIVFPGSYTYENSGKTKIAQLIFCVQNSEYVTFSTIHET